jgi:small subunit ribosomal protein S18
MQDRGPGSERRGGDHGEGRSHRSGEPPNITIRRPFFRRRKTSPFAVKDAPKIDYKDVKMLQRFVSERELARAVKRARLLALLPFVVR